MKDEILDFKPSPSEFGKFWLLEPDTIFINHGAFGACPVPVLEVQQRFRQQLERQPLRFFGREYEPLLDASRGALAEFVGADTCDLVFVPNATTGVNAVLRSLKLTSRDELLTTDHEYNACRNVLDFVANQTGARVVVAQIPFPIESPQQVVEAVMAKVSPQTRLVLIDHVTSQTGLILPLKELVGKLNQCGIDTLVDGAHAPGMLSVNLREIGATYYTGNCHKWLSAPKGAAFLYVRRDKQGEIRPMTISHGANSPRTDRSRFQLEFDWMGTDDTTSYLCVGEAIKFMGSLLAGGWTELMARNRMLALEGRRIISEKLGMELPCPDEMIGSIAVVSLPDTAPYPEKTQLIPPLQESLFRDFGIEVPVIPWPARPKQLIRISAQIYNTRSQYEYLASAIAQLLA